MARASTALGKEERPGQGQQVSPESLDGRKPGKDRAKGKEEESQGAKSEETKNDTGKKVKWPHLKNRS